MVINSKLNLFYHKLPLPHKCMELNYKKIGLLIGFVALVAVLGFLIYFLFFRAAPATVTPGSEVTSTGAGQLPSAGIGAGGGEVIPGGGSLPSGSEVATETTGAQTKPQPDAVAAGGLTQTTSLSDAPTLAPTLGANGSDMLYYNKNDGKFYRSNQNGTAFLLSDKTFFDVQNVTWAPDKQKAVIEYPDGANIVYNFQTDQQYSLPAHWKDFDFSPDSARIVAKSIGSDPDTRWLMVANDDGSQAQALEPIGDKDATVYPSWSPNNLSVATYSESIDFDRQRLYFVGLNHENFKSTVIEGRGFEEQWSPAGESLLYSVYNSGTQLKPTLWVVDAKGESIGAGRTDLNLQTWAHKCTFADSATLYCAVPNSLPEGAGLFPELAQQSVDSLYKVNLKTGAQTLVAVPDGNYNMENITVSADGSTLYFSDALSGRLRTIRLK